EISIQDHGIGIPAELIPKIFDRFYRVKAVKDPKDGLGLGLFITQALVKGHGGEIRVESEPGKGSTFHVSFPSQLDSTVSPDAAAQLSTIVAFGPETPK